MNKFSVIFALLAILRLMGADIAVGQYTADSSSSAYYHYRNYPNALTSLLREARQSTGIPFDENPIVLSSFSDKRLATLPFLYINWDDREDWKQLPAHEVASLRNYLLNGGFLFIDAGIRAAFLEDDENAGQHHSFGEWRERQEVREFFERLFPGEHFRPLSRSSELFRAAFAGLPDSSLLPDTVREYTVNEKWPDGTYSAVALFAPGPQKRMMAVAMPIIAMGWSRNSRGGWENGIRLRVLEQNSGLDRQLSNAAVTGKAFSIQREDGGTDTLYCQKHALPAWVREPGNRWRVFRYYDSRQIDDFAHIFYLRLGINLIVNALHGN